MLKNLTALRGTVHYILPSVPFPSASQVFQFSLITLSRASGSIGNIPVQLTSSRVRLGQSFKTVGYGSASCWGDLGAGSVEADVFYVPFIVSVQYIGY